MFVGGGCVGNDEASPSTIASRPIGSNSDLRFLDAADVNATMGDRILHDRFHMDMTGFRHSRQHYGESGNTVTAIIPNGYEYRISLDSNSSYGAALWHYEFILQ